MMQTTKLTGINRTGPSSNRVSKIESADFSRANGKKDRLGQKHELIKVAAPTHHKALTVVDNVQIQRRTSGLRPTPSAPLIAQLIATHLELPQTRCRRRASFNVASGQYANGVSKQKSEMIGTRCFKTA